MKPGAPHGGFLEAEKPGQRRVKRTSELLEVSKARLLPARLAVAQ